jgi:hypothetical protein
MYIGEGSYYNSDTPFYTDKDGKFSLGDKLYYNGTDLSVQGTITASGGKIAGWDINSSSIFKNRTSINTSNLLWNKIKNTSSFV